MKIRTDFVTNSSSTGYVVINIETKDGFGRAYEDYDSGYGGWIWNYRNIHSIIKDLGEVQNGEDLYQLLMESVNSFEYISKGKNSDIETVLNTVKSRDDLIEIELEEETRSDEVADHDIYKFRLKYDFKDSRVIELEDGYHDERQGITSLSIPYGTMRIEDEEYRDYNDLTSVTIPESVKSIGNCAFYGCDEIKSVFFSDLNSFLNIDFEGDGPGWEDVDYYINGELAKNIAIPDGGTSIGPHQFGGCSSLTDITISNSVASIENEAFFYCTNLKKISISSSVKKIGKSAFEGCDSLTDITIPGSVTKIDQLVFAGCPDLKNVTILDGVTIIEDYAFDTCVGLTNIVIPNSVTTIGKDAFSSKIYDFIKLENLTIHAHSGSYAEEYAKENNIPFKALD